MEEVMQRLNANTVQRFVREADLAVVMFGSPESQATMAQAIEFALTWADNGDAAQFGYVDAFENIASARAFGIRLLPTTLLMRNGDVVAKLEGRQPSLCIEAALRAATAPHRAAAA
jgi:thioredoxin-like negative regulator of GroEL